jgi:hypothetical protein
VEFIQALPPKVLIGVSSGLAWVPVEAFGNDDSDREFFPARKPRRIKLAVTDKKILTLTAKIDPDYTANKDSTGEQLKKSTLRRKLCLAAMR